MVWAVVVGVTAAGMFITASFPPLRYQPHCEQRVWYGCSRMEEGQAVMMLTGYLLVNPSGQRQLILKSE